MWHYNQDLLVWHRRGYAAVTFLGIKWKKAKAQQIWPNQQIRSIILQNSVVPPVHAHAVSVCSRVMVVMMMLWSSKFLFWRLVRTPPPPVCRHHQIAASGRDGTGEMCVSVCTCTLVQICACARTFQFCPIEEILWGILYIEKKSFVETCRHMPLSLPPPPWPQLFDQPVICSFTRFITFYIFKSID